MLPLDAVRTAFADRFDVLRELGHGGMASVFLARDRKHDREVALKVLHPDLARSITGERFLREVAIAAKLTEEEVARLYEALRTTLTAAVLAAEGRPATELKDAKRAGMNVHGRTGEACPVCGDTVHEVSFADSSLQYCPTCQTGGKELADRRMSRLLR